MSVSITLSDGYLHPRAREYLRRSEVLEREAESIYRSLAESTFGQTTYQYVGLPVPRAENLRKKAQRLTHRAFFVNRMVRRLRYEEDLVSLVDSLIGWTVK